MKRSLVIAIGYKVLTGLVTPVTAFSVVLTNDVLCHCRNYRHSTTMHMTSSSDDELDDDDDNDYDEDYEEDLSLSLYNPIENETPEEREARMKLVRQLQKSFYKDEQGPSTTSTLDQEIIENLPLWRVQWTELPGSQNILNVHVPHYTNMFQKILRGSTKAWGEHDDTTSSSSTTTTTDTYYFGHIFLPEGSENLDNPQFALQPGDVGTLMKISDSRQQSDGRLTLVVQALERFRIHNVVRSHSPYGIADVQICVDREQGDDAVPKALENHPFEYRTVRIDECQITTDDGQVVSLNVSPFSNYDGMQEPIDSDDDCDNDALVAESDVWMQLDELLKLLRIASNGLGMSVSVPVPTQVLGLLPKQRSVEKDGVVTQTEWPSKFALENAANRMEQESRSTVGTYSKSPFVRVSNKNAYSPLRRAQRLSFMVWTLTDSIALPDTDGKFSPETILRIDGTRERLELANEKMQQICLLLKKGLRIQ